MEQEQQQRRVWNSTQDTPSTGRPATQGSSAGEGAPWGEAGGGLASGSAACPQHQAIWSSCCRGQLALIKPLPAPGGHRTIRRGLVPTWGPFTDSGGGGNGGAPSHNLSL